MRFFRTIFSVFERHGASEAIDQGGHYLQGYTMAKELSRWGSRKDQIALVMTFAVGREYLQHPDRKLGEGSKRDLDNWRRGARAGASKG